MVTKIALHTDLVGEEEKNVEEAVIEEDKPFKGVVLYVCKVILVLYSLEMWFVGDLRN